MYLRPITQDEYTYWDTLVNFPTQSLAWARFQEKQHNLVELLGIYTDDHQLVGGYLLVGKKLYNTRFKTGRITRSQYCTPEQIQALDAYIQDKYVYVTLEPYIVKGTPLPTSLRPSPFATYAQWTPEIDMTTDWESISRNFSKAVRNESRFAEKNNITVTIGSTHTEFEAFLSMMARMRERKTFLGHSDAYYTDVYETLAPFQQIQIANAYDRDTLVASACIFDFHDTLYYVYAGSLGRQTPKGAMYLLIVSVLQWGKKRNKKMLDLFGSLGPTDTRPHPWQGFTTFKKSFGPHFVQFVGAYDLIAMMPLYRLIVFTSRCMRILTFIKKRLLLTNGK